MLYIYIELQKYFVSDISINIWFDFDANTNGIVVIRKSNI